MNYEDMELPEGVTEEMLDYLDGLRESGETNMFGATPYLQAEFALDKKEARAALMFWMQTFTTRQEYKKLMG